MANHKPGDRVRIACPASNFHNLEATVVGEAEEGIVIRPDGTQKESLLYPVDVDGYGRGDIGLCPGCHREHYIDFGFPGDELIPINKPGDFKQTEWYKKLMESAEGTKLLEGVM